MSWQTAIWNIIKRHLKPITEHGLTSSRECFKIKLTLYSALFGRCFKIIKFILLHTCYVIIYKHCLKYIIAFNCTILSLCFIANYSTKYSLCYGNSNADYYEGVSKYLHNKDDRMCTNCGNEKCSSMLQLVLPLLPVYAWKYKSQSSYYVIIKLSNFLLVIMDQNREKRFTKTHGLK